MDTTEDVLRRVAAGELTPEEALRLLDGAAQPEQPTGAAAYPPGAVTAVRIVAAYRQLEVTADPEVAEVLVTGNHTVRRDGGLIVIETPDVPERGEEGEQGRFSFAMPRPLAWARALTDYRLGVRINPHLPLELEVTGASVRIVGGEAGLNARLLASALKVDRVRGPLTLDAMSSSVKGALGPTGSSRIGCESSSVKVSLMQGTDMRIHAINRMGKIVVPGRVSKGGVVGGEVTDSVVGSGRDQLEIDALMSSVVIG